MYKMIAIDIDGTLVDSNGNVSEANKMAIKNAIQHGTEVVLTSGRIPQSILPIAEEIGTKNYLIAGNGALVYDINTNQNIYGQFITKEKTLEIIKKCKNNNAFVNLYLQNEIITETIDYSILFYESENEKLPNGKKMNITVVEDLIQFVNKYEGKDFLKVTICEQNKLGYERIIDILTEINGINFLNIKQRTTKKIRIENIEKEISYYYTEIMDENVNKWSAIEFLIKKINITKDEVLTIGDNMNDAEMIKNADTGIAMGNSNPEIKEIANYVVADNNSNGVAEAIIKFNS